MSDEIVTKKDDDWRDEHGKIKPGHTPPGANHITHENAREMANARWAKSRAEAAEGLRLAVQKKIDKGEMPPMGMDGDHTAEAWGRMVMHAADIFLKSDSARGLSDLGSFIGKAAGSIPDANAQKQELGNRQEDDWKDSATIILAVFQRLDERIENGDIIDADIIE